MKKIISSALLALSFLISIPAHADEPLKFGVKTGLNVSDFSFSSDVFDKTNQVGWFFGPTVKFTLPVVGLGMDASVIYDMRSAKLKHVSVDQSVKQQEIAIPINARYSIGLGSMANIFFFGGPQIAFNVGARNFEWTNGSNYALKKSNFSVNLGLLTIILLVVILLTSHGKQQLMPLVQLLRKREAITVHGRLAWLISFKMYNA